MITEARLPELTGSPKQIVWAGKIRALVIQELRTAPHGILRQFAGAPEEAAAQLERDLQKLTVEAEDEILLRVSAALWIDERRHFVRGGAWMRRELCRREMALAACCWKMEEDARERRRREAARREALAREAREMSVYLSGGGWGSGIDVEWTGDCETPDGEIAAECRTIMAYAHDGDQEDLSDDELAARISDAKRKFLKRREAAAAAPHSAGPEETGGSNSRPSLEGHEVTLEPPSLPAAPEDATD